MTTHAHRIGDLWRQRAPRGVPVAILAAVATLAAPLVWAAGATDPVPAALPGMANLRQEDEQAKTLRHQGVTPFATMTYVAGLSGIWNVTAFYAGVGPDRKEPVWTAHQVGDVPGIGRLPDRWASSTDCSALKSAMEGLSRVPLTSVPGLTLPVPGSSVIPPAPPTDGPSYGLWTRYMGQGMEILANPGRLAPPDGLRLGGSRAVADWWKSVQLEGCWTLKEPPE